MQISSPSSEPIAQLPLGIEEFSYIQGLVRRHTGIHLGPQKRALVSARLASRLRALGLLTYRDYCERLRNSWHEEQRHLFDALCTHETRFFRESAHFDLILSKLWSTRATSSPGVNRPLRIWSAGCSTGEEAYSLAMLVVGSVSSKVAHTVEVLGTDLSHAAIERARLGLYPIGRMDEIPRTLLNRFMQRGKGPREGTMRVGQELRSVVRFERCNLHDVAEYPRFGLFDIIFCRNVLIYFDQDGRRLVSEALLQRLLPGGMVFFGHADGIHTLPGATRVATAVHTPHRKGTHVDAT